MGWTVIRVWGYDLSANFCEKINEISLMLSSNKAKINNKPKES